MRVVYSGAVVSNGGDAAIMDAQIALLTEAIGEHQVVLHDNTPAVARRLYPSAEVHWPTYFVAHRPAGKDLPTRLRRRYNTERVKLAASRHPDGQWLLADVEREQVNSLATADLVAYTGGTTMIERYSLLGKVYELELARKLGRPTVLLPASLGPFTKARNQDLMRGVAEYASLILLRDERSLVHLRDIGADTSRAHVVPDVVFALGSDLGEHRLREERTPDQPRVAISVRDIAPFFDGADKHAGQLTYEMAMADLVTVLVNNHKARVTFLSTCQGIPEYWTDDSRVAQRIVDALLPRIRDQVVVDGAHRSHAELAQAYAGFDLLVATRMHAGIIALGAGTPVLPVAYEFKINEVMGQLGIGEYVINTDGITSAGLVRAYDRFLADLPGLRPTMADRLATMRQRLRELTPLLRQAAKA